MPKTLFRFSSKVFNTPQLIHPQEFRAITSYIRDRNLDLLSDPVYKGGEGKRLDSEELSIFGGVGVIQIEGPITYKPVEMLCAPEGTSYLKLIDQVEEMVDAGVKAIVFECSSGGGEARGMFDTSNYIRNTLTKAGVASYAYIDEMAASACYGLACICDEVIIHPEARAGSIGAVIALLDDSKADEMEGYKEIYVTSTPGKVPFASDGSFKQSFLDKLQLEVNKLGNKFVKHCSTYTGVSEDAIKALDAQMFDAEESVEKGLANSIMDHAQFSDYISNKYK